MAAQASELQHSVYQRLSNDTGNKKHLLGLSVHDA